VAAGFKIELVNNVENIYLVKADAKRLKQVFINLISNAIKYNHKQGKVTINVKNIEGNKVRIFVSDTGSGLTDEQIQGLFQPFQRYDSSKEGLGLGLYISQQIVELMGGVTGVESELNKGSTFWFELSLA
jgi:signal transduction histidine kinase